MIMDEVNPGDEMPDFREAGPLLPAGISPDDEVMAQFVVDDDAFTVDVEIGEINVQIMAGLDRLDAVHTVLALMPATWQRVLEAYHSGEFEQPEDEGDR